MNIRNFLSTCSAVSALLLSMPSYAATVLYGVTGDGASVKETLYTLDQTNGNKTLVMALGNGNDGEVIAYNPDDQLLYHWSGFGPNQVMESINPTTLAITPISLSGDPTDDIASATYDPIAGHFLAADLALDLFSMSSSGVTSTICSGCMPQQPKGLAFASDGMGGFTLYSGSANDNKLWTRDPSNGAILTTRTITISGAPSLGVSDVGLAVNPETNELWGLLRTTAFDTRLVTIDPDTGSATQIGILSDKFSSIAFVPTPVPLPPALLLLGSGLLGLVGIARRRTMAGAIPGA